MEIGSEFWIDKSNISEENCELPAWLNRFDNVVLTSSGRGAISLLLGQVKPKIKRALLPSYICESVIIPFEQAGYELTYYDIDKKLKPVDIDSIKNADIGIFLHMGYFGFLTNEDLVDTISILKSNSVIVIEDVTHTLFSNHQKPMDNDFVIGSIRKWFGIPSGGFLASGKNINSDISDVPNDFVNLRISGLQQKFEYIKSGDKTKKSFFLSDFRMAEEMLDEDVKPYRIDKTSEMIIKSVDIKELEKSRKTNFEYLSKHLSGVKGIEAVLSNVGKNVTPMFYPIYVDNNRDKLRSNLIKEEIYCPVHWPIPYHMDEQLSSTTRHIYDSILSIPCDQRYCIDDMQRVIKTLKKLI